MSTARKMTILFFAVVVLAGAIFAIPRLTQSHISTDPQQLYYDALNKNLSDTAAACTVSQSQAGTTQQLAVQLDLASKTNAHSELSVTSNAATVKTEEIVLKSGDYLRYTKVAAPVADATGSKPDFSKILNLWIKTDGTKPAQLFNATAMGGCAVPLADIPTASKPALDRQLTSNKVFVTDFSKTTTATIDHQPVRVYNVAIQPVAYATYMQAVAKAYGLSNLQNLNAADYTGKAARQAKFMINTTTGRLAHIQFTDENRDISFSGYGTSLKLTAPTKTITNQQASTLVTQ